MSRVSLLVDTYNQESFRGQKETVRYILDVHEITRNCIV